MGTCQNIDNSYSRLNIIQNKHRCLVSANPPQILIEEDNGTISKLPIQIIKDEYYHQNLTSFKLINTSNSYESSLQNYNQNINSQKIFPQLYLTDQNRIYYSQKFDKIDRSDLEFGQTAHAFFLMKKISQICHFSIRISNIYLTSDNVHSPNGKVTQSNYIILQSFPLSTKVNDNYVDLVNLGCRMKVKGICWQDSEYLQIIRQTIVRVNILHQKGVCGISNIIIGNDGSLRVIGKYRSCQQNNAYQPFLKQILLTALYGQYPVNYIAVENFEKMCKFKHPQSLSVINQLQKSIKTCKQQISQIKSPYLKFIQGYIQAYFYKIQIFSQQTLNLCVILGNFDMAKKLCNDYIHKNGLQSSHSEQAYRIYSTLLNASQKINQYFPSKQEQIQNIYLFQEICYKLAVHSIKHVKYSNALDYLHSLRYYALKKSEKSKPKKIMALQTQAYLCLFKLLYALDQYSMAQKIAIQAISHLKNISLIKILYIFLLCDCLRLQQAENTLLNMTNSIGNIQMQVCSAKILIIKAASDKQYKERNLERSEQKLKILSESKIQMNNQKQDNLIKSYIYELWADINLQRGKYKDAAQLYHSSQIYNKQANYYVIEYRSAHLLSAEANCYMLIKQFKKSQQLYIEALKISKQQFCSQSNTLKGNLSILKLKQGWKEQAISQLQNLLNNIADIDRTSNINYVFYQNILNKYRRNI